VVGASDVCSAFHVRRAQEALQELLLPALLPSLQHYQKEVIRECLTMTQYSELLSSRLVDWRLVERETALWVQAMREALEGYTSPWCKAMWDSVVIINEFAFSTAVAFGLAPRRLWPGPFDRPCHP
jgi:hypothetical protein